MAKKKRIPKLTPERLERKERVRQMLLERIDYYEKKLGPWKPSERLD